MTALPYLDTSHDNRSLRDLKDRLDCQDFYQAEVGTGRRSGKAWVDKVPWRDDHKPSLNVYSDGWLDRATGERGDIFALAMQLHNLDFRQAIEYVSRWAGGALPRRSIARPAAPSRSDAPPTTLWQAAIGKFVERAQAVLHSPVGAAALAFLYGRGLTDASLQAARIGYNSTWYDTGLRSEEGTPIRIKAGIVIPAFDTDALWYVKVRTDDGQPKYTQVAGGKMGALYNADRLRPGLPIVFHESELDALLGWQLTGDTCNHVALGGTSGRLPARWRSAIQASAQILLCRDNDEAGQRYADRNGAALPEKHHVLSVPRGKDLTDYVQQVGPDMARAWLRQILAVAQPAPARLSIEISNARRAALRKYLPDCVAPYLEFRTEAIGLGLSQADEKLTIAQLVALAKQTGREVSEQTIRRATKWLANYFGSTLPTTDSSQGKTPDESIGKADQKSIPGGKPPHRQGQTYAMPSAEQVDQALRRLASLRHLEEAFPENDPTVAPIRELFDDRPDLVTLLEEKYGALVKTQPELRAKLDQVRLADKRLERSLRDPASAPLPVGWKYCNGSQYIDCCARALKQTEPERDPSLAQWAELLGASQRSVGRHLKGAGITSIHVYEEKAVTSVAEVARLGYAMRGFPKQMISPTFGERTYDPGLLERELALGGQVTVRFQKTNRQVITSEAQPDLRRRRLWPGQKPAALATDEVHSSPASMGSAKCVDAPSKVHTGLENSPRHDGRYHDPVWRVQGRAKLLALVTGWQQRGDTLLDRSTGELLPYSAETVLKLLLDESSDTTPE